MVEAEVTLADGTVGKGCAPSGASTGEFEALVGDDLFVTNTERLSKEYQGSVFLVI